MARPANYETRFGGTRKVTSIRATIAATRFLRPTASPQWVIDNIKRGEAQCAQCFACERAALYRRMLRYNRAVVDRWARVRRIVTR